MNISEIIVINLYENNIQPWTHKNIRSRSKKKAITQNTAFLSTHMPKGELEKQTHILKKAQKKVNDSLNRNLKLIESKKEEDKEFIKTLKSSNTTKIDVKSISPKDKIQRKLTGK